MRFLRCGTLLAALVMILALTCGPALGEAATPTDLTPCQQRGDDPFHEHILMDWVSYTPHYHSARCEYPGCTRMVKIPCTEIPVETGNGEITVCPVCGTVTRDGQVTGQVLKKCDAQITDSALPWDWWGYPVVRAGAVDDYTVVVTTCYQGCGRGMPHTQDVQVLLSDEDSALLEGFTMLALGGAQDENLSFSFTEAGRALLTMRFARRPAAVMVFVK